jgi:hypothetical protein
MATLLAPAMFAATIYMVLGRLVRATKSFSLLIIPEQYLTVLFVGGDVFSFLVQSGGCRLMVMGDIRKFNLGGKIVVIGLAVQIVMFGLFVIAAAVLHIRLRQRGDFYPERAVYRPVLKPLYSVSILILVRSIYRIIQFVQGLDGYLLQTEWPTLWVPN